MWVIYLSVRVTNTDSTMATDVRIKEQLPELTKQIVQTYRDAPTIHYLGHCPLPNNESIVAICEDLKEILYPGYRRREIGRASCRERV